VQHANAIIGRALRLLMIPAGPRLHVDPRPSRALYALHRGARGGASPWPPYHASHGLTATTSAVTLFAASPEHARTFGDEG
jgi:hypothetical protein